MSQATLLGICSDNVVTILSPSSTIECGPSISSSCSSVTTVGAGPSTSPLVFTLPLPSTDPILITGCIQLQFSLAPSGWASAPPLTYLQIQYGSDTATSVRRYISFHYNTATHVYTPLPIDISFSFLANCSSTVTVTSAVSGVSFQGSLWFQ